MKIKEGVGEKDLDDRITLLERSRILLERAYNKLGERDLGAVLELRKEALSLRKDVYGGKGHSDVVAALKLVGFAYENLGDVAEGKKYLYEALEMQKDIKRGLKAQALEANKADLEVARQDLALVYCAVAFAETVAENYGPALFASEKSWVKRVEQFDERSEEAARGAEMLGASYHKLGNYILGLFYLFQAVEIMAKLDDGLPVVQSGIKHFFKSEVSGKFQMLSPELASRVVIQIATETKGVGYAAGLKIELSVQEGCSEIHPFEVLKFIEGNGLKDGFINLGKQEALRAISVEEGPAGAAVSERPKNKSFKDLVRKQFEVRVGQEAAASAGGHGHS